MNAHKIAHHLPKLVAANLKREAGENEYKVKKGDILGRVANLHSSTVEALKAINPQIGKNGLIYAGDILKLPPLERAALQKELATEMGADDAALDIQQAQEEMKDPQKKVDTAGAFNAMNGRPARVKEALDKALKPIKPTSKIAPPLPPPEPKPPVVESPPKPEAAGPVESAVFVEDLTNNAGLVHGAAFQTAVGDLRSVVENNKNVPGVEQYQRAADLMAKYGNNDHGHVWQPRPKLPEGKTGQETFFISKDTASFQKEDILQLTRTPPALWTVQEFQGVPRHQRFNTVAGTPVPNGTPGLESSFYGPPGEPTSEAMLQALRPRSETPAAKPPDAKDQPLEPLPPPPGTEDLF